MLAAILAAAALQVVTTGSTFACTPTAVWDGDGPIWCAEGPRIRLSGIAAREMDGSCRTNHPCPDATAIAARDALVRLLDGPTGRLRTGHVSVRGPTLSCVSHGSGRGSRTAALCRLPDGRDLSCEMVRTGTVARWGRYGGDRLCR